MTEQEYRKWLRSDAKRTVLLEIDTNPVRRLSVLPYTTLPDDVLPNIRYDAVIKGSVGYQETLSIDGGAQASYAVIELHNEDGSLDAWLDDVWHNRKIDIYFGDVTWPRSDYRLVASGVVDRCEQNQDTMSIVLMDKLKQLDNAMTEELVGGTGPESERLKPIALGENHNVTPRLYSRGQHEYVYHIGQTERLIEARDNGLPVEATAIPGGFRLARDPTKGTITASVQGDSSGGYQNTIAKLIEKAVTQYGPAASRFTSADLDTANLTAFNAANPQPVGIYLTESATVSSVAVQLAASVGAEPIMSRTGQLRLLRVELPAAGTPSIILPADYEEGSLEIAGQSLVVAGVRLLYCRNWTPRQQITEGVPAEHQELYAQEYLEVVAKDSSVASTYRIDTETMKKDVLLLTKPDAQAEAARLLALWSVPRTIYKVRGFAHMLELELGSPSTLYGNRFGLENGKTGQIIGLYPDWAAGRCDVEVLV